MQLSPRRIGQLAVARLMELAIEQEANDYYDFEVGDYNADDYMIGESEEGDELREKVAEAFDGLGIEPRQRELDEAYEAACKFAKQIGELMMKE